MKGKSHGAVHTLKHVFYKAHSGRSTSAVIWSPAGCAQTAKGSPGSADKPADEQPSRHSHDRADEALR